MTKKKLLENLKNGEVVVTFKKKDGTIRVMKCTQSFDKFGWDAHKIEYIEQFEGLRDEGYARENHWIAYYKSLGISLNKNGGK